jgi:hypothetical protein
VNLDPGVNGCFLLEEAFRIFASGSYSRDNTSSYSLMVPLQTIRKALDLDAMSAPPE